MPPAREAAPAARPRLPSGWLSDDESAAARALRAWPLDRQLRLAGDIAAATRAWAVQWGAAGACEVRPDDADVHADAPWQPLADATGTHLRWRRADAAAPSIRGALLAALFGERGASATEDRMADRLVDLAWRDWCERVAGLFAAGLEPAAAASSPFDGSLRLRVSWPCGDVLLEIGGELAARWMSAHAQDARRDADARARPVPLMHAVGGQPVAVRAELRRVDVELGKLLALRPGDVFCTGHPLDAPLSIRATGATAPGPLCAAHLGARDGWLAVELLRDPSFSSTAPSVRS